MNTTHLLNWPEDGSLHSARWRSERSATPPERVLVADDRMTADAAYRLAAAGTALLWRGDFQNARQLQQALARRVDRKAPRGKPAQSLLDAFHQQRQQQAQRAELLSKLLIPIEADYRIPLRRAPEVLEACREAWGEAAASDGLSVVSLRELQGLIGAHEWRRKGVAVAALGDRIHPHYGVFSPIRGEYLELVARAPLEQLPSRALAFDIGTGTGVLAALLARRGFARICASDRDPRALACARENLARLGGKARIEVIDVDLFPPGRAALIVCNPPWLPGQPSAGLEHAVYDPDSRMLRGFLGGLGAHLEDGGEGWLIMSDLAERIGLRQPDQLETLIAAAGLKVLGRLDTRPQHKRAADRDDPLYPARAAEVTSLWRLARRDA
jgi:methylase of polypeptide subunit release factors